MNENFEDLLEKFKYIAKKRWIKSVTNGHGNIGLTFEKELGKNIDCNYLPDYKNIELKCSTRYSRFPITLFCVSFDGPTDKEIIRLNNTYGSMDKDIPTKKTLIKNIRFGEITQLNSNYLFDLIIRDKKLFLRIYDLNGKLIEQTTFVHIETIKKHLLMKLNNLAIIRASKKIIDNKEYFRYYEINFYKLKNSDVFFELLKNGFIEVIINSSFQKSGKYVGIYHNKGLIFQIKKYNIEKLFDKIYHYNNDNFEANEIQFL